MREGEKMNELTLSQADDAAGGVVWFIALAAAAILSQCTVKVETADANVCVSTDGSCK